MSRFTSLFSAALTLAAASYLHAQVALPPVQPVPAAPAPAFDPNALKWDAETKKYEAKAGEASASFTFNVTNVSQQEVSITSLRTSCGCTVAQLPPLPNEPYKLAPGSNVAIGVTMDLRGKFGTVTKTVNVDSSAGPKALAVHVNIPQLANTPADPHATPGAANAMGNRAKNIQNALADRQAVFKGECASCHVQKGVAKLSKELYSADCAICHDAEHRAAMVPDLKVPRSERDLAFWQKWIMEGKPGTLMPAFATVHGGPLTQEQIDSLTIYLYENFPKKLQTVRTAPVPTAPGLTLTPPLPKN